MADLKQAYRALDPAAPATSERYVARPDDPVGLLAAEFQIRETPMRVLIGGQRGVGKTTELRRLQSGFEGADLVCALISLTSDMMADESLLATIVFKSVAQSRTLLQPLAKSALKRFERPTMDFMVTPWRPPDAKSVFREFVYDVSSHGRLVLLFDGMEKIGEQDAAQLMAFFAELSCSIVAVAPLPLLLSAGYASHIAEWDRLISLSAISSRNRDGSLNLPGVALLRRIVERRAGEDTFARRSLDVLLDASAGIHRELLMLAQQACLRAAMTGCVQVREEDARAAVEDKRQELSFHLTPQDIEYLSELERVQRLTADPRALPLLNRNLIVSYQGDWTWFDVHPLIKPLLPPHFGTAQRATG